jgi:hypothetical protein
MKVSIRICLFIGFISLSAMACTGTLFNNYGRIIRNSDTDLAFKTYQINADIRYYISGSDVHPRAIMGLHRDYHLDPKALWKEVDMTPKKMKDFVDQMQDKADEYGKYPYGFNLYDNKNQAIGVWYSISSAPTLIYMQKDGSIRIDTPKHDTYRRFELELKNHM